MSTTGAELTTVRWRVPELLERPAVGTSCCASTAEAIVAQELSMLPGIEDVLVNCGEGEVTVTYRPAVVAQDEIAAALDEIGYPPAA